MELGAYRAIFRYADTVAYLVRDCGETGGCSLEKVSQGVSRLLGFELADFERDPELWRRIVHPDDLPKIIRDTRAVFRRRESRTRLYRFRHKVYGEYLWIEANTVPLIDDGGNLVGVGGLARDVSAQQRADRRSEHETALLETMPDGLLVADRKGRILHTNATLQHMLGYSPVELESLTVEDLVRSDAGMDEGREGNELMASSLRLGPGSRLDLRVVRKDGVEIPVDITLHHFDGEQATAVVRDVTEARRALIALYESEQKYQRIAETAEEGIYEIDPSGSVTYANAKMASLLGSSVGDLIGRSIFDFVAPEMRADARAHLERVRDGVREPYDLRFKRKDGADLWTILSTAPVLDGEGRFTAALVMATDITEREKLKNRLAQGERLESIGRLSAGIAHDFNNLLTVINGYADMAIRQVEPGDLLYSQLQEIRRAGDYARGLTQQLLAFSRGQLMQPEVLNLNLLLQDSLKVLRRLIGEDIELKFVPSASAALVRAEPDKIRQVIFNLAANARDAMPRGGGLTIQISKTELDEAQAARISDASVGAYIVVTVTDSGEGMDEQTQEHIFEPFFSTKEMHRGTGLGLSTVYGIVRQTGGFTLVHSEPKVGTSFEVYLPVAEEGFAALPASDAGFATPSPQGTETVLVVEDYEQLRWLVADSLRGYGYRVLEATNGREALEVAKAHPGSIRLLVTDVVMPFMNGPELAAELGRIYPAMKIIYMSGYADGPAGTIESRPGVAHMQKPFRPAALAAKARELLGESPPPGNILIVEDDPAVRSLFAEILQRAGYSVRQTSDGLEALREMRQESADVVVTDLVMPGMEGMETIQHLHGEFPGTRIIAVSGRFDAAVFHVAEKLGAYSSLPKPVSPATLLEAVGNAMAGLPA